MADTDVIPAIAFNNQLAYDVIVYDSFDNDDNDGSGSGTNGKPDSQAYFATLTQLGKVPAGATVNIQPIHDSSSAFVVESASDNKPVKRMVVFAFDDVTSLSIVKDDETAMAQTFQFVSLFLNNPNDALSVAFNKVLNKTTDDLAGDIDNFFAAQPAYSKGCFEDYMMAMAYTAQHPAVPNPSQPQGSSSLKIIAALMGFKWPDGLSDIFVTKFTCTSKDKHLVLTFEVDVSTLPFQTAQIGANVLTLLSGTKMVKAQILFNYAIGLNIFGTRLSLLLDALNIPIDNGKTLTLKKPEVSIDINPAFKFVVFTIKALFPFNINGKTFNAIASFVVDNEEAAIGIDIQGDNSSLPPPPGIKGLHFDEFGVGMGLFFTPPGFALGLLGKFHIGEPNGGNLVRLNDDTFAFVCEFVEEAVEPKYVAFSVPQLSLNQVVELFTNANPHIDIPVNFSDLSFHWSDGLMDAVVLPDGTLSGGGYGFTAAVNIFSFGFYGEANLDINSGLTANVQVSPINWSNVFKLTGDGKGYSLKVDSNGNPIPNNFVPKTAAEKDAVAKATDKQIVTAGGPSLIINTLSMPILHLNAKASLFEIAEYSINADINQNGIFFTLDFGGILTEQMTCQLSDFHNFYGGFKFGIDRKFSLPSIGGVSLGSIHVEATADAHIIINTSVTDVVLKIGGGFDFEGTTRRFGDFSADIHIKKIGDVIEAIISNIAQYAEQIFADFVQDAEKWAAAAKNAIIDGYNTVADVLKNAYKKTSNDVAAIMKGIGYTADEVAKGIKDAFEADWYVVVYTMKCAGYAVNEIGNGIKNAWNCGANDVATALKGLSYIADDTASAIKSAFNAGINDVASALKDVGYAVDQVSGALKNTFNASMNDVASAMRSVGYAADQVASALKDTFNASVDEVESAMKAVGYRAQEVINALKNIFSITEISAALKNVYGLSVNEINSFLQSAGYAASDVENAFKSLGGDFADFATQTWDKIKDPDTWNPSKW